MAEASEFVTATERLGKPPAARGLARVLPREKQSKLQYAVDPASPTATCHLQPSRDEPALCGFPFEALIEVPGNPPFGEIGQELRCETCARRANASAS